MLVFPSRSKHGEHGFEYGFHALATEYETLLTQQVTRLHIIENDDFIFFSSRQSRVSSDQLFF